MRLLEAAVRDNKLKFLVFIAAAGVLASGPVWVQCRRDTSLIPALAPGIHGVGFITICGCAAVVVITFVALLYSIATARRSTASNRNHSALVEILWALIPMLIVLGAALPSVQALTNHSHSIGATYKCEMSGR